MSRAVEITDTQLTNALRALDINFIMGGQSTNEPLHKQPARLTLQCYYTAAVWLGKKYQQPGSLPDYFSENWACTQ